MRLLNTLTLTLHEFFAETPEYVILSHTWEDGEVTFDDIDKPHAKDMPGYRKIVACCHQAIKDGFEWTWIDTCCIDKRSSAELQEAINSMFAWYWKAELCYAYLADVHWKESSVEAPAMRGLEPDFVNSRWFTRGWTLQELLAPPSVEFFDHDWRSMGSKFDLIKGITKATRIEQTYVRNRSIIQNASIATRFRWASRRLTKRPEDVAYCLLGLFRVHMPLIYGEGAKAFYRLQLELLKQSEDYTIFAWNPLPGDVYEVMGILAPSPREFSDSASYRSLPPKSSGLDNKPYEMTNRGLRIALRFSGLHRGLLSGLTIDGLDIAKECITFDVEWLGPRQYRRRLGSRLQRTQAKEFSSVKEVYVEAESRLKTIETLSGFPCILQIDRLRIDVPCYQLVAVVVCRDGLMQSYEDVQDKSLLRELRLVDNEWVSLNFIVRGVSFTTIIGQHQSSAGLAISFEKAKDMKWNLRRWWSDMQHCAGSIRGHDQSHYFKHQRILDHSSVQVELRASKMRTIEQGPRWSVTIEIADPRWGVPAESTAVLKERLREAGV